MADLSLSSSPTLSVVVPVHNEEDNVAPLVEEIVAALGVRGGYEIVYVDDGSGDGTWARLEELARLYTEFRAVHHAERRGQSAAVVTGVRAARGSIIATLDGDGQNDPTDILKLLAVFEAREPEAPPLMVAGNRTTRRDTGTRRIASRIANGVRSRLLGDATPDTGCGLKVFGRDIFLAMPAFDHMHRFLPALMIRGGGEVVSVPVGHRPRARGSSKYGIWDRLWVGIVDLAGVMWLKRRPVAARVDRETGTS